MKSVSWRCVSNMQMVRVKECRTRHYAGSQYQNFISNFSFPTSIPKWPCSCVYLATSLVLSICLGLNLNIDVLAAKKYAGVFPYGLGGKESFLTCCVAIQDPHCLPLLLHRREREPHATDLPAPIPSQICAVMQHSKSHWAAEPHRAQGHPACSMCLPYPSSTSYTEVYQFWC